MPKSDVNMKIPPLSPKLNSFSKFWEYLCNKALLQAEEEVGNEQARQKEKHTDPKMGHIRREVSLDRLLR